MAGYTISPVVRQRMDRIAGLVADGATIAGAAKATGCTKGQAMNAWRNICNGLGSQAQ